MLKGSKVRGDVSLLLSREQMGGLAMQLNELWRSLFKYSKKFAFLHYLYLDFDDIHASVFQLAVETCYFSQSKKWKMMCHGLPSMC
jgi:hypothetical protein